jgi:hypothetical protein
MADGQLAFAAFAEGMRKCGRGNTTGILISSHGSILETGPITRNCFVIELAAEEISPPPADYQHC